MSNQILELAKQAGLFVELNGNPWPRALSADECVAAYNKFAQLIVKECADIATMNSHQWEPPGHYVRKHFGIIE